MCTYIQSSFSCETVEQLLHNKQEGETAKRRSENCKGFPGPEGTNSDQRKHLAPFFMFPLHVDSRHVLHPGSLTDLKCTVVCSLSPFLELNPAETGGHHSMHNKSTQRLIQWIWLCAALCTHWATWTCRASHLDRVSSQQNVAIPTCKVACME